MSRENADVPERLIECIEQFFGRDLDGWLACFEPPFAFVTAEGTVLAADVTEARRRFGPAFEALQAAGFASSVADRVSTSYVDKDMALVDAAFTRRHRDGSPMGRMAALYVCRRRNEQWRIAAVVQHSPERSAFSAVTSTPSP